VFLHFLKTPKSRVDMILTSVEACSRSDFDEQFDVIVVDSATQTGNPQLSSCLSRRGNLFVWDNAIRQALEENPWSIGHALELEMWFTTTPIHPQPEIISPGDFVGQPCGTPVQVTTSLFHFRQAYILLASEDWSYISHSGCTRSGFSRHVV